MSCRTPLSLMHGYAYLLLTRPKDDTIVSQTEIVQSILTASSQLNKTVTDLINVANVEMGDIELFITQTTIDHIIHSAWNELSPVSQGRHLFIEISDLNHLPAIQGDAQQLQQVFWNLLSNAVKYTPDGGQIQVYGRTVEGGVEIVIEDTGIGIDPDDQQHIFGRFNILQDVLHHTSSDTSFMGGGLGLGLFIVKGIVEAHGGRVWVESEGADEEGCPGSRFYLFLPLLGPLEHYKNESDKI